MIDRFAMWVAAQPAPAAGSTPDLIGPIITAVISASVFAALITGLVQYLVNRRNARITERKNAVEAESDLIARYKEAATEERVQKESAVQTVKNLLALAEAQVASLKDTVNTLNKTIEVMSLASNNQQDIIDQLTLDRDRTKEALARAEHQIEEQREELLRHQREILALQLPRGERVKPVTQELPADL